MDFPVDCQLFLRMTGAGLGDYGQYRISTSGVSSRISGQSIEDCDIIGSANDAALHLDFNDEARLPFPTTAKQLSAWQQVNNDFQLPDWFYQVAEEVDYLPAANLVNARLSRVNDLIGRAQRAVAHRTTKNRSRLPAAKQSQSRFLANRDALEKILCLIGREPAPINRVLERAVKHIGGHRGRKDALSEEIDALLLGESQPISPRELMVKLRLAAGKDGSVVEAGVLPRFHGLLG